MPTSGFLIACALEVETLSLREKLDPFTDIVTTGLGTKRTRVALREHLVRLRPRLLIFTGTAGQLDPKVPLGQVVFPESWRFENNVCQDCHPSTIAQLRRMGWKIEGVGLTLHRPVLRPAERLRLFQSSGALICDMETVAALQTAAEADVPSLALKVVSDTAESGASGFWTHLEENLTILAHSLTRLVEDLGSIVDSRTSRRKE